MDATTRPSFSHDVRGFTLVELVIAMGGADAGERALALLNRVDADLFAQLMAALEKTKTSTYRFVVSGDVPTA